MNTLPGWRSWIPEGCLAAAVLVVGLLEVFRGGAVGETGALALVAVGIAAAVLLCRHAPGAALAIVWAVGALQIVTGTRALSTEVAVAAVAFGCARWGHPTTVAISGVSIPLVAAFVAAVVTTGSYGIFEGVGLLDQLLDVAYERGLGSQVIIIAAMLGMATLALPWLAGLALRASVRARRSEVSEVAAQEDAAAAQREAAQAQEIARLRDDQARLARDVHDVVGHSLAVILAQAESAQYLPDDATQLKSTLATIATSARSSLQDVRQVLASTATSERAPAPPSGLESLVEGIRASGQEVVVDEVGPVRPLPPELEVVAHRVLQEMLTNAVKHGLRDRPIRVERHWPAGGLERDLRLEVSNGEPPGDETQPLTVDPAGSGGGQGIDGMRRRLDSVGGRIDVRRRVAGDGATFTATAWVPVSGR